MSWKATAYVKELRDCPKGGTITSSEKLVLFCLADYHSPKTNLAWPTIETLADDAIMSVRNTRLLLASLVEKGVIEILNSERPGRGQRSMFLFCEIPPEETTQPLPNMVCSNKLRQAVIQAFEMVCSYCTKKGDAIEGPDGDAWNVDRIVPGKQGGGYTPDNVTLACRTCNRAKGVNPAPEGTLSLQNKDANFAHLIPGSEQKSEKGSDKVCNLESRNKEEPPRTSNKPLPALAGGKDKETIDPRHSIVREKFKSLWLAHAAMVAQPGSPAPKTAPWNGRDAGILSKLLTDNPSWTSGFLTFCLDSYFHSENITGGDPFHLIAPKLTRYSGGRLDRFNKPAPRARDSQDAPDGLAEARRQRAAGRASSASGEGA